MCKINYETFSRTQDRLREGQPGIFTCDLWRGQTIFVYAAMFNFVLVSLNPSNDPKERHQAAIVRVDF